MKAYPKYKASGIDWLGEIPSNWDIISLKYLCDICTGNKDTINRVDDGLYPFFVRSPKVERINSYSYDGEAILMAGDGVGAGKVFHYINGKFDFHQRVYNFHNFDKASGKFLYYYLQSNFKYVIEEGAAKSTVDSVRLPWLKSFPVALPEIDTQREIVSFLDKKLPQIDALITEKQAQIEDLRKFRTSLITEIVSHGLNPQVQFIPSSIKWLGNIPAHWEASKLKYIGEARNGLTYSPDDICDDGEGVLVLRSSNIQNDTLSYEDNVYVSKDVNDLMMKEGDILICSRNGSPSLVGKCTIIPHGVTATFGAFMMRFRSNIDKKFTLYLIRTALAHHKELFSTSTINQLTNSTLGNIEIAIPPLDEQHQIVDYLDEKTAKIDTLINELTQQLDELALYRKAVISEAVTGKVDVREWKS